MSFLSTGRTRTDALSSMVAGAAAGPLAATRKASTGRLCASKTPSKGRVWPAFARLLGVM
jgi:hypothetical protein